MRCPGMDCPDFKKSAGKTWEEKAENACTNCTKCNGNFPLNPDELPENFTDEVEELYEEVRDIILEQNAGFHFEIKEVYLLRLVVVWREVEWQIKESRSVELVHLLKQQNEILKAGLGVKTK